jgi:Ca2+-binding RTX toxin-like protein
VLANGANSFTLGASAQNVSGGTGDDSLKSGALSTVSGTLDGVSGNDTLTVEQNATVTATLANIDALNLANNVNVTTSLANNALIGSALGSNTVTLNAVGVASGAAEVENYVLADGGNTFTLGASAQNVTGGTGDDSLKTGALTTVGGTLDGVGGNDTLTVELSGTLSATLTNIDAVILANNVNLTTSITNNALITTAAGSNTVTLSDAGTASGAAQVENYQLADGGNIFTLAAAAQNVTGGSGADVVHTGALTTVSGTLALGGGNDTLVVDTTATNISTATLTSVESLQLGSNVNASMSIAQHALLDSAAGANTVTLTDAGSVSGAAEVESYQLANGGNSFTLGANGQDVSGGSGIDVVTAIDTQLAGAVLDGGGARDTVVVTSSAPGVSAIGGTINNFEVIDLTGVVNGATFTATATVEEVRGGAGADDLSVAAVVGGASVSAGTGADTVTGGAGNDVIDVGVDNDADLVNAGGGSDTVTNFGAGDTINYEGGADTATYAAVTATVDGGTGGGVDTLTVTATSGAMSFDFSRTNQQQILAGGTGTYSNFENLAAGAAGVDDAITVVMSASTTAVTTGSGDDTITFRSQSVSVDAGAGTDTLVMGGSGVIVVDLSTSGDQVGGLGSYTGFENLDGSASSATLVVIGGENTATVRTGSGNDSLSGGLSLDGGAGNNNITADSRTTTVVAGSGNDNLDASAAAQGVTVNLGDGANQVLGSAFADSITLGAGADIIDAGAGSDDIIGVVSAGDALNLEGDDDTFTYQALNGAGSSVDGGDDSDTLVVDAGGSALIIDFSNTNDQIAAETGSYRNFENLAAGNATVDLTVITGSAGGVIVTGSGDDDVTLSAANDDVSTGAGDDVINVTAATLNSAIDAGGNTATGDTLNVLGGGTLGMSVTAVGIENVSLAVATDFTANALGGLRITGSAGDDTITVGAADQVVAGAGGDDVIKVSDAVLASTLSVDGGAATSGDTLAVTSDATVIDGDFAQVVSIETLQLAADAADNAQSVTVGANAEAGGLLAIDTTTAGADDDITIDASGFSAALAINTGAGADHIVLGAGGSTVNAGAGDNTVTVGAANDGVEDDNITSAGGDDYFLVGDARLTGNLDIAAGGGSDSLEVTTDASVADADLAGLVSVERLLLGADAGDDAQAVTLGANAMAAGLTGVAVVDTATNDDISVDASAFNNALAIDTGAGDDQLVLGSGGSVVDARGGNNVITVGGANDGSQDDSIVTQGGNDRVLVSDAQLTHFLSVSAGAGSDTLELTSDADIVDADLAGLAGVEILALTTDAGDDAQGITLGTAALAAGVTTVDGTAAGGDDALTIDSQAFSGALTINTAAGADAITLGAGGSVVDSGDGNDLVVVGAANDADTHDVISTGLGADAVQVDSALFTEHLVLDGGNANDTLRINLDVSVVDADFTQVTSVEAIALIADASGNLNEITLGSAAAASGLASIDATPGGSDDVLHLDARAFANALNVTSGAAADVIELGGGGSTVNAGNGNNIITVGAVNDGVTDDAITTGSGDDRVRSTNAQLTDQLSINAGTGLDTVEVTSDASVVDADFTQLLSVETLGLSADAVDNAQNVVLGAQAANAGLTHVDASGVGANDAIGIDASGFANALAIDTAAGDDVIVLGAGGSVVDAGDGDNDITLGAANDGVHDDVITVGAGADRIVATSAQVTSHLTLDAGAGSDTLEINTDVALVDVDFGGVDALETLKLVANAADDDQSLTLGSAAVGAGITTVDALGIGADDSLTINAAGFNAALSIDSAASTDVIFLGAGGSTVNSGDGNDTVFSAAVNDGTLDDHLDTGTGNDIIHIDSDNFTANFVLDGGEDFDVLRLNGEVAVVDADFTHLARVEKLEVIADASGNLHTLTLDSAAAAAGIGSVDATSAGGDDVIVVDAQGFANALSIDTGAASDVITLGAGGSIVHAGDGNNTIVVGAANDGVHDDEITTGAGNDLIKTDDARFSNALLVSAGTGTDTLEVTDDAAVLDAALTQVTSVEVLKLSGNADDDAQSVTLAAHAASAGLTTLNASALGAGDALTVDASAFANALTIQTAAGDDVITLGGGGSVVNAGGGDNTVFVGADNDGVHDDHITTGAGADVVNLTDAQFSANFSFSAGAGRDEIRITSDASLADADLAGLTSVEVLTLTVDAADDAQSVVLGANAEAAGIHTVDGIGIISTDALSIDASSFSHGLTITTSLGDDVVLLGSGGTFVTTLDGADTVTVGAANDGSNNDDIDTGDGNDLVKTTDARLTANLSVIGGLGTDTLEVTSDATVSDADFTNLRGIERLTLSADAGDDAQSLVLGSLAHSAGLLAVDTTAAGSDDGINIDASAFSAGLSITSGAGDDVITLGSAGSTVTSGLGDDTVTAGAGQDDIDTGAGDDTINVSATTIAADIDGGADTGAGDTLSVTGGGAVLMGASVVNVEKVSLVSATDFIANAISGLAITGSTGDDLVHVGAGDQVVAGAGGDDIVDVEDSELSATLFVDGGAHTTGDILLVSTDASVADADLANVTTMEVLKLGVDAADHVQSVTLAANAAAAGFTHLDTTLVGSGESVNIDSTGFANALTIDGGAGSEVVLLGTGGSVVNAGAGTDHVTVGADNDGVHDDVIHLGASSDRVELTDSQLSAHLTVSGDDGTDRLEVTDDASLADADLAGITTLEVLVLKGDAADNAQSVVFAGNALSAGFTTIDASDVGANDAVSVNAAAFSAGLTLTTSSGDDIIVLGAGGSVVNAGNGANTVTVGAASDNITTGGGDDLIKVEDGKLGSLLGVAAGNGLDTLEVTSDADIAFGEFDGMTGVEVLKLSGNAADDAQLVFLGADAEAVGLTTIDSTTLDSGDSLALRLATFGNALTINTGAGDDDITLGSGGSVVDSGNGNDVITVGAANDGVTDDHITAGDGHDQIFVLAAQLSSHLEIAAGNGIDALNLASDSAVSDADFTLMTALEQVMFDFDAADNAQSITVAGLAAAAGVNRIDARFAGNDDAITIDASGFANALTIDTNGAADSIVLGAGGSVVDAGNGDNIITIGADNDGVHDDDITTGSGADLFHVTDARLSGNLAIAAGGGVDVLLLDSDADVTDADLAQVSSVEVFRFGVDAGDDAQGVVLAANAMAAGVATVDISQAGANDAVTVDASAYTTSLTVILHGGADIVTLGSGNDTLLGGVSAGDSINLGAGDDSFAITTLAAVTIDGGTDLDTLVIGAGAGSRQLDFSNGVDQLSGFGTYLNFENLQADAANGTLSVIAGHGTTSIVTGSKIDQVDAGLADQGVSISTGASGDSVIGSAHNDSIDGGTGEDFIAGGDGNDALTGGAGADTFVFDTALSDSTNVDTISDFVSGADLFQLNLDIFSALQATDGVLDADNFLAGAGAVASNGNQHIILDTTSGSLFYDADGLGGVAQVEFARLGGAHTAVATDFVIG